MFKDICYSAKPEGSAVRVRPWGFLIKMKFKISNVLGILCLVLFVFFILYGFILHGSYSKGLEYSIPASAILVMIVQWFEKDKPQDEKPKEKPKEEKIEEKPEEKVEEPKQPEVQKENNPEEKSTEVKIESPNS